MEQEKQKASTEFGAVLAGKLSSTAAAKQWLASRATKDGEDVLDLGTKLKLVDDRKRINQMRENIRKTKAEYLPADYGAAAASPPSPVNIDPAQEPKPEQKQERAALKNWEERRVWNRGSGTLAQLPGYQSRPRKEEEKKKPRPQPRRKARFSDEEDAADDSEGEEDTRRHPRRSSRQATAPAPQIPPPYPSYYPYPYPPAPPPWLMGYQNNERSQLLAENLRELKEKMGEAVKRSEQLETQIGRFKEQKKIRSQIIRPPQSAMCREETPTVEPTAKKPVLAQNMERKEDLEAEEKAMLNLVAQEHDSLRMLSSLDPKSELYQYKLEQYKQMSAYRTQLEKALQRQRLEKLKYDFNMQKRAAKLSLLPPPPPPPAPEEQKGPSIVEPPAEEYVPPAEVRSVEYNEHDGFILYLDYVKNVPETLGRIKLCYNVFDDGQALLPTTPETEFCAAQYGTAKIAVCNQVAEVVPNHGSVLVVEMKVEDETTGEAKTVGWTFVELFDAKKQLL